MSIWIDWDGGEIPVDLYDVVEVQLRNSNGPFTDIAKNLNWWHSFGNGAGDIVRYRKVDQAEIYNEACKKYVGSGLYRSDYRSAGEIRAMLSITTSRLEHAYDVIEQCREALLTVHEYYTAPYVRKLGRNASVVDAINMINDFSDFNSKRPISHIEIDKPMLESEKNK